RAVPASPYHLNQGAGLKFLNERQQALAELAGKTVTPGDWQDWKWHVRNAVRTIDAFEDALGIRFSASEKAEYERTLETFPMSVTPYYLSLIDVDDYRNDPVF